jgi:oxalate decarboxylase/phosphoglucose isomerase-like protein (cupin superfamily)
MFFKKVKDSFLTSVNPVPFRPGEIIYFPDRWWHATLNIDTTVFMSTFLSP